VNWPQEKEKTGCNDTKVFNSYHVATDTISKICLPQRWYTFTKRSPRQEDIFRVHLLEDPSIKLLYQKRLEQNLIHSPCSLNINVEWQNFNKYITSRKRSFRQTEKEKTHLQRMPNKWIPLKSYHYRPQGRRSEDRKNVGKINYGDRTDQRVHSLMFMTTMNQRWDQILTRQKTTEPTNLPPAHIPSQHLEQHLAIHSKHGWEKTQ
jgi:hypothetical protein